MGGGLIAEEEATTVWQLDSLRVTPSDGNPYPRTLSLVHSSPGKAGEARVA